jgi:STE24 endopeptidase
MHVPVDVRDDRDTHRRRTLAALAAVAFAAGWALAGAFLWRTSVPQVHLPELDPRAYFSAHELARAEHFRRVSRALALASLGVELVVLAVFAWKGRALADALLPVTRGRLRTGLALGLAVALGTWLALLPLGAVSQSWTRRFGLSHQGYLGWLGDQGLALLVEAVLVLIAVAVAMALAGWLGGKWWLVGGPALAVVGFAFVVVQPLVIEPLFNRFEPLGDRALAAEIQQLARREGVAIKGVSVSDASRRTTTENAYVSGLGPTRRVVFWDTILHGRLSRGEILAVAAHELAHVAHRHVWKWTGIFGLLSIPGVLAVALVTERAGGGGVAEPGLVPLGLFVVFVFFLATLPLQNAFSRRYEAEADWTALEATHDPRAMIGLQRQLSVSALGDPDPPGWVQGFFGTHPTTMQRIAMAKVFEETR